MGEAIFVRASDEDELVVDAAAGAGEVWQLYDGRAGFFRRKAGAPDGTACAAGERGVFQTGGEADVPLTDSITILRGGEVWWDHSANKAHFKKVNDRDFYVGRAAADSSSSIIRTELNVRPKYDINLLTDAALVVPVGTQAVGGFGFPKILGGAQSVELTATNEAQKIDILSVDGFAKGANAIARFVVRIADDGAGTAADFNVGVANGTNATDADSITESIFFHFNANSTTIYAESDDGTVEVNATDTTTTYTEGSAVANRKEFWIDMRNPADCQLYVDGVNVLPATVFNVDAATGPFFLLVHLEKTSSTDAYRAIIDAADVRFMEQ